MNFEINNFQVILIIIIIIISNILIAISNNISFRHTIGKETVGGRNGHHLVEIQGRSM